MHASFEAGLYSWSVGAANLFKDEVQMRQTFEGKSGRVAMKRERTVMMTLRRGKMLDSSGLNCFTIDNWSSVDANVVPGKRKLPFAVEGTPWKRMFTTWPPTACWCGDKYLLHSHRS